MTPYTPGTRVVVRIPEPVVGVVRCLTAGGMVVVDVGDTSGELVPDNVVPAMPRDRADLERWGRWWWLEDRAVEVFGFDAYGNIAMYITGNGAPQYLSKVHNWRGPVAPPPEVRS